jgi:hypothetical protein
VSESGERWEYLTTFVSADSGDNSGDKPKYAPESMARILNQYGADGWELVHMQPVYVGKNNDVALPGASDRWTNRYFCVFKRRAFF